MKTWFTSDTHYDHRNIIGYCSRPFADVNEMNLAMMDRWNERVGVDDLVYHLGDFHLGKKVRIPVIRGGLNGRIVMVRGNHDRGGSTSWYRNVATIEVVKSLTVEIDGVTVHMSHRPQHDESLWKGAGLHLHGHVHERYRTSHGGRAINVGVDVWDFRPMTLEEMLARIDEPWEPPVVQSTREGPTGV